MAAYHATLNLVVARQLFAAQIKKLFRMNVPANSTTLIPKHHALHFGPTGAPPGYIPQLYTINNLNVPSQVKDMALFRARLLYSMPRDPVEALQGVLQGEGDEQPMRWFLPRMRLRPRDPDQVMNGCVVHGWVGEGLGKGGGVGAGVGRGEAGGGHRIAAELVPAGNEAPSSGFKPRWEA